MTPVSARISQDEDRIVLRSGPLEFGYLTAATLAQLQAQALTFGPRELKGEWTRTVLDYADQGSEVDATES